MYVVERFIFRRPAKEHSNIRYQYTEMIVSDSVFYDNYSVR